MRILGISGSLRADSHNTRLLRAAALELPPGAQLDVYEDLAAVPPYDEDLDAGWAPTPVVQLRVAIANADAVLIATPEYNSSVPGQLKNALDWASRPHSRSALLDKPVAVVGASTGIFGAVWAQADVRRILESIGARVLPGELPVGQAHDAFTGDGSLDDPRLRELLAAQLAALVEASVPAAVS